MKNWFGRETHPSDGLIQWSEVKNTREFQQRVDQLRADWDLLHATPQLTEAFERLVRDYQRNIESAQAEIDAGGDL